MINYILQDPIKGSVETLVTGHNRPLYFKRPLVATLQEANIHLAVQPQQSVKEVHIEESIQQHRDLIKEEEKTRTVEVQTLFRESEAQTEPYSPRGITREGETPEVMSLSHLKFGKGLPVTIDELDAIELNREKILFENSLPPISDEASFLLRRNLMEAQELREWNKKDNEIKKIQNEKLYLLQSALIEREKDVEERNAQRIEEIKLKKTEQKNRLIAKIQRRKIKILRKISKRRKEIDVDKRKREIIEEYANFGSKVYAGITREGLSLDKIANKYEVQPAALASYKGITDLHQTIPPKYFDTKINVKKIQENILKQYTRLEIHHKDQLKKAKDEIGGKGKKDGSEESKDLRKYSLSKMKPRPVTPVHKYGYDIDNITDLKEREKYQKSREKRELAVLLLQRLLRGRAMQNIMYEGKEKRLALIDELLTVAKIQDLPAEEVEEILLANHEEKVKNAMLEALQGEVIAQTLDVLSKELLRFQQEKNIAKMVEMAERDRNKREIQESGRRQAEETLRHREDVLYNEIMKVHQGTVDNYLHWIIENTIENAANRQAIIMTKLRKEKLEEPLEGYEKNINKKEVVIKDLVSQFLIPNVQREKIQKRIELEEQRFAESAKKSLHSTLVETAKKIV